MKKRIKVILLVIIVIILLICGIWHIQKSRSRNGYEQGYLHGYSIGYTDALNNRWQSGQLLACEIVPFEAGDGKWKYFIMGFTDGYDDGHDAGDAYRK